MAIASGYQVTVLRNGSAVAVKSGSVTRSAGKLAPSWEITLAEPMNLDASDTWTIRRKLSGRSDTLISNAIAVGLGGSDGTSGNALSCTRRVSGDADEATNPLLEYCVPITLCFVNWSWVKKWWSDAMIKDGALVHGTGYSSGVRIFGPRLPGKEMQAGMYQVIGGCYTHHAVAQYLAGLVGYNIEIGVPDIPIVDTFTVPSGTTWYAAIKKNLDIWFPVYEVVDDTIYVHDICADDPVSPGQITLTNAAIESASLNRSKTKADAPLDHLIITGRRTENSEALLGEDPDFTPVQLAAIDLAATTTETMNRSYTDLEQHKTWESYTGTWGLPDDPLTKKNLKSQVQEMGFYVDEEQGEKKHIQVTETIHTYNSDDTEIAKTVISYTYAKGFKPIKTTEDEYAYCHLPGSETKELRKVRTKTTVQDQFIKPLNLTLTSEIVEGLILYDNVEQDGETYKVSPRPFADELRQDTDEDAIETDPDTTQATLEDTINYRTTHLGRTHDNTLIKRDLDYNKLSGNVKVQSQILENPKKNDNMLRNDDTFRKEYKVGGVSINGLTCYHSPRGVDHPDITNATIADQIAARAFVRKSADQNDEWQIEIPVPFLPRQIGCMVSLPDFPVNVNGSTVTVDGGSFVLREAKESFSFDGNKAEGRTSLTVRAKY